MIKIIIIGVVLFLVYMLFFKKIRQDGKPPQEKDKTIETMCECHKCKVLISKNEAILSNGKLYCSKECLA